MNKKIKLPECRTERRKEKVKSVLEKRQLDFVAVFENINDPHNLSACLRSCDAVGIHKIYLIYHSGQPFPKLGRESSASAKKWVEIEIFYNVRECFEKLKNDGFKIYTTHMNSESTSLYDLDLTEKVALVFGNEHAGISIEALKLADKNFLIPQVGMIQSLNISVACAVSLFEGYRQRQKAGSYNNNQFAEEFEPLLENWLSK